MHAMKKLPKLPLSRHYFVSRISSKDDFRMKFNEVSDFVRVNSERYVGVYSMDYSAQEGLSGTMFFIVELRRKKNRAKDLEYLQEQFGQKGMRYISSENREIQYVLKQLSLL